MSDKRFLNIEPWWINDGFWFQEGITRSARKCWRVLGIGNGDFKALTTTETLKIKLKKTYLSKATKPLQIIKQSEIDVKSTELKNNQIEPLETLRISLMIIREVFCKTTLTDIIESTRFLCDGHQTGEQYQREGEVTLQRLLLGKLYLWRENIF